VTATTISGYGHDQLVNAAYVIQAGKDLNLSSRDQTIGVMTAMGESGLRVLNYGDAVGPDSRGLFQQRANGGGGRPSGSAGSAAVVVSEPPLEDTTANATTATAATATTATSTTTRRRALTVRR